VLWWSLLGGWNLIVFAVFALDKLRAKRGWRRTPEATLLWLAALAGGPGALLAMHLVHHKTRKPRFAWGVPLLTLVQAVAWWWGWSRGWW
jgi:uncharacterized membrane protein YsdA (DUF1294 family)